MKISIIVPIYNGEVYLEKTISSLLNQPYKDIELILVNDGSTDHSLKICRKYESLDKRVIVIDQENGGISVSRNNGIIIATGDYISFIDQDDEISPNIYNVLTQAIDNCDLCIASKKNQLLNQNGEIVEETVYKYTPELISNEEDILKIIVNYRRDTASLHLWNCLYNSKIIHENGLRFNEKLKFGHEDTLFNIQYLSLCKRIQLIDEVV